MPKINIEASDRAAAVARLMQAEHKAMTGRDLNLTFFYERLLSNGVEVETRRPKVRVMFETENED